MKFTNKQHMLGLDFLSNIPLICPHDWLYTFKFSIMFSVIALCTLLFPLNEEITNHTN